VSYERHPVSNIRAFDLDRDVKSYRRHAVSSDRASVRRRNVVS